MPDPHPRRPILNLCPSGGRGALTKTDTKLLSQESKSFRVAGAQEPAVVRFCSWCLEELACSAWLPCETLKPQRESGELGAWSSSVSWHCQEESLFKTPKGTPCDEQKGGRGWEWGGGKFGTPGAQAVEKKGSEAKCFHPPRCLW